MISNLMEPITLLWYIFIFLINGSSTKVSLGISFKMLLKKFNLRAREALYFISCVQFISLYEASNDFIKEDARLSVPNIVIKYGYPMQTYNIITPDGYILELHRIKRENASPILLAHGLTASSAMYVIMGPKRGLAYYLFDNGYDVWMANDRGTTYSPNHKTLKKSSSKYWDFSFHEIGIYDLPTSIDFVLQVTGRKTLHLIGYSQGGLTPLVMGSERPEYMSKISLLQLIAPAAFIGHAKSPLILFFKVPIIPSIADTVADTLGIYDLKVTKYFMDLISQSFCKIAPSIICKHLIFLMSGYNEKQFDIKLMPLISAHFPAGCSIKQLRHFGQSLSSGKFRQFDYGWLKNLQRYGTKQPPDYNLGNIRTNVAVYHSKNDFLVPMSDIRILLNQLPVVVDNYVVPDAEFSHVDFWAAKDIRILLHERILKDIKRYENGLL